MSRIGKKPIPIPTGVTVTIEPEVVRVAGPRGDLFERKARAIEVREEEGTLLISRPGQRTYVDSRSMPKVLGGMGTSIISTSRGVMTGHDARREGVGGELVAQIW